MYKIYVSDALKAISENTTHLAGIGGVVDYGSSMSCRWYDSISPEQPVQDEDPRSCLEIAEEIFNKILNVGGA